MRFADAVVVVASEQFKLASFGDEHGTETPPVAQQRKKKPSAAKEIAKTVGLGTLGAMGGMAAGYGTGKLIDAARGSPVPPGQAMRMAPFIGAGLGTSFALWKHLEAQKIRDAIESSRNQPG
jgi:hypothetical protein